MEDDNPTVEREIRQGGLTPQNVDPRMFHDIQVILARLVGKAHQLIRNATTNLAECWMHIRTNIDGGKVINPSQSGSWENRCMGAGLRQNLGPEWGPEVWTKVTHAPNKVFTDVTQSTANCVATDRKRKATDTAKEQRRKSKYMKLDDTPAARRTYDRHDDGISPDDVSEDIPPAQLQMVKTRFSVRDKTLNEACSGEIFCLEKKVSKFKLKRKHNYYYEVQCQLYSTDTSWCDFVVRTERDIHVERVYRDRK